MWDEISEIWCMKPGVWNLESEIWTKWKSMQRSKNKCYEMKTNGTISKKWRNAKKGKDMQRSKTRCREIKETQNMEKKYNDIERNKQYMNDMQSNDRHGRTWNNAKQLGIWKQMQRHRRNAKKYKEEKEMLAN